MNLKQQRRKERKYSIVKENAKRAYKHYGDIVGDNPILLCMWPSIFVWYMTKKRLDGKREFYKLYKGLRKVSNK